MTMNLYFFNTFLIHMTLYWLYKKFRSF